MAILRRVILNGFKSIKAMDLELRPLNVLIGANGAGKSNLVSFFKMLNEMMAGRLQQYIGTAGRAHSLLHFGPKVTPEMGSRLEFTGASGATTDNAIDAYEILLAYAAVDTLVFTKEFFVGEEFCGKKPLFVGSGHLESLIINSGDYGPPEFKEMIKTLRHLLDQCQVYHFHDTSSSARARGYCYVGNDRWLMPDAGNLAAMLYRFRRDDSNPAYRRILGTIRQIAPFIADFVLEPTEREKDIILNWQDKESGEVFGPHQLSDGTLRFIALATLLLQPQALLPDVMVIDEPELGLHPAALNLLGGLLKSASHHTQVVVATQSAALVDGFDTDDVIVVNRCDGASTFERLREEQLKDWLQDYTLGQLWEKNVVGGGPFG